MVLVFNRFLLTKNPREGNWVWFSCSNLAVCKKNVVGFWTLGLCLSTLQGGNELKQRRFWKIAWIRSHHLHLEWKFKLLVGTVTWGNKAKHCWVMSRNFLFSKVCWQLPAMFYLYTSSKLSRPWFEFSLKVKVMGLNPGYLLKYFVLYLLDVQRGQPINCLFKLSIRY